MRDANRSDAPMILTCLNPRRFELLLYAARLGGAFTVAELRQAVPASHSTSIGRDVVALETNGLLIGDPPVSTSPRQGHTVTYTVPSYVPDLFDALASAVKEAWPTA